MHRVRNDHLNLTHWILKFKNINNESVKNKENRVFALESFLH